ncbi:hypothetical protein VN97_g1219 [Penicillium thymicola]|uniref:Uncharacterized protein n=1 Tax=Penicillium thymicola TaxID=293382 RepID=A0AAI9TS86_PENTH|nr:hypothetical protein VN97_g1219 [Penicillium thymicola]
MITWVNTVTTLVPNRKRCHFIPRLHESLPLLFLDISFLGRNIILPDLNPFLFNLQYNEIKRKGATLLQVTRQLSAKAGHHPRVDSCV